MEIDNSTQPIKTTVPRTPAESLARQVELLEAIRESLDYQQRLVMHLAEQQNTQAEQLTDLSKWVNYLGGATFPDSSAHPGLQWVKVQDVNVPFLNLAMFLVKLALASIPAAIVLWVIGFLVLALFSFLGLSLFRFF